MRVRLSGAEDILNLVTRYSECANGEYLASKIIHVEDDCSAQSRRLQCKEENRPEP